MSQEEIDDFRDWHEKRLQELQYPMAMTEKLRSDRERWLPKAK